ncbi:hypothetical protein NKR23_g12096 [Pleurostoma richardsiae]|uniref:Uncharacterized protein n=1 Tax=Pleurostoma richardsiae TaxID=41990 RepID=A0AA38VJ24_9PEZI|nr:hypothetical protein NKR23_g12096 [Pleurostoma richardsiae]
MFEEPDPLDTALTFAAQGLVKAGLPVEHFLKLISNRKFEDAAEHGKQQLQDKGSWSGQSHTPSTKTLLPVLVKKLRSLWQVLGGRLSGSPWDHTNYGINCDDNMEVWHILSGTVIPPEITLTESDIANMTNDDMKHTVYGAGGVGAARKGFFFTHSMRYSAVVNTFFTLDDEGAAPMKFFNPQTVAKQPSSASSASSEETASSDSIRDSIDGAKDEKMGRREVGSRSTVHGYLERVLNGFLCF